MVELTHLLVSPTDSIWEAMSRIDRNTKGIVLMVDEARHLLGAITDGDVRRALLAGQNLNAPVRELVAQKVKSAYPQPITAPIGTEQNVLLRLMKQCGVRHLPLIDREGQVAGLVTLDELVPAQVSPLQAVVMAGGLGTRLRPLTEDVPKPMLPVGDRPLMEHIVDQLRDAGIRQVSITTHYKPESIVQHFGDGQKFGVNIKYVNEDRPLGTAGALGLMAPWMSTLLVINGDILTGLNYRSMLIFHQENKAVMTVGVRQYGLQVPYGVVETDGVEIQKLSEKPVVQFFVNAGVYLLEPAVHQYLAVGTKVDMTDLIARLLMDKQRVVSFPISEYWLDIGQHVDYERAQKDVTSGDWQNLGGANRSQLPGT